MKPWVRRKILIWGKTRPELSKSHKETVCTGGIFEDTKEYVRLYPIPLRYLDDERYFRKYQWIEADVRKAFKDPRPESYNIRPEGIVLGDTIPTGKNGNWDQRAEWVLQPDRIFETVGALQAARESNGTSIGLVKPDDILRIFPEPYPEDEKRNFWEKYRDVTAQQMIEFDPELDIKPISPPDYRFKITFQSGELTHEFAVFDWEVDALYFRLIQGGDSPAIACAKVIEKLKDDVCGPTKDTYFFLGNIATHPHIFTIVGLWYPKMKPAMPLFAGMD